MRYATCSTSVTGWKLSLVFSALERVLLARPVLGLSNGGSGEKRRRGLWELRGQGGRLEMEGGLQEIKGTVLRMGGLWIDKNESGFQKTIVKFPLCVHFIVFEIKKQDTWVISKLLFVAWTVSSHYTRSELCMCACSAFITIWDPVDCSLPGSSIHGIFQARILEWIAHFLLRGTFSTQGSNLCLLHWQADSLPMSHLGSPRNEL